MADETAVGDDRHLRQETEDHAKVCRNLIFVDEIQNLSSKIRYQLYQYISYRFTPERLGTCHIRKPKTRRKDITQFNSAF